MGLGLILLNKHSDAMLIGIYIHFILEDFNNERIPYPILILKLICNEYKLLRKEEFDSEIEFRDNSSSNSDFTEEFEETDEYDEDDEDSFQSFSEFNNDFYM